MTQDDARLELETDRLLLHTLAPGDEARLQRVFEACADHFAVLMGQRVSPEAAAGELAACASTPGRSVAVLTRATDWRLVLSTLACGNSTMMPLVSAQRV